jgi:hypothetical protein
MNGAPELCWFGQMLAALADHSTGQMRVLRLRASLRMTNFAGAEAVRVDLSKTRLVLSTQLARDEVEQERDDA